MELVAEKYKQTDIGMIPSDWEVRNLLDNFTLKARIGWQGLTTSEYLDSGDYSLVTGTDFKHGYIDWDNCVYVEKIRYVQDKNIQLKVQDVLVTKDGTIGKVAFIDRLPNPTTLNSGVFVLRPKRENIDNKFFYYLLMSFYFDNFLAKITAGSTINHLYQKDFVTFNFILPTLTEQTLIATALSDADALISSLEKLIAKKRNIKQGAMQKLLQPKEGWEVKKLGEVAFVNMGQSPLSQFYNSEEIGLPLVQGNADVENRKTIIRFYTSMITKKGKVGDIIMSVRAPVGEISKATFDCCLGRGVCSISFDNEYLYHYLIYFEKSWAKLSTGSTFDSVNSKQVIELEIPIPKSKEEQARIATIFSDMDKEITALETKLEKYKKVKLGMMQNLLTGKIRLI